MCTSIQVEQLLQRNHSPRKFASDQQYRLQQGFLISSTQQVSHCLFDHLSVRVCLSQSYAFSLYVSVCKSVLSPLFLQLCQVLVYELRNKGPLLLLEQQNFWSKVTYFNNFFSAFFFCLSHSPVYIWPPSIKFDHGSTSWLSCLFDCCSVPCGCRDQCGRNNLCHKSHICVWSVVC